MSTYFNRRDFVKLSALAGGGQLLNSCANSLESNKNMCDFAAPKIDKVRVAVVGLGNRGYGAVQRLMKIADLEIVAFSDLEEAKVKKANALLKRSDLKEAKEFFSGPEDYKGICDMDIDLMYCVTSWDYHTPISVYAMESGVHAATEVPAGKTIDEMWELVETSERTQRHCMMLENCCYDFFELTSLNMVRQGVFGELTHAEGAYIHCLSESMMGSSNENSGGWRRKENIGFHGNLYPTHGLGPIAQCRDINRGNRFEYLVSMSSQEAAFSSFARKKGRKDMLNIDFRGDMNTCVLKTSKGQTVMIQHDVSSPRPYSRIHMLQGSRGMVRKYPRGEYALIDHHKGHQFLNEEERKDLEAKYRHPLIKTLGEVAKKVGGHGGMDFMMDYRLIYCLKNGLPLDQNVYDAATWTSLFPLSIQSVKQRSSSVQVPDFTRGKWKTNKQLPIVDLDPKKLKLYNTDMAKGQLSV
jgi:predicted dehydrogenase